MRTELERRPILLLCIGLIVGITAIGHAVNAALLLVLLVYVRGVSPRMWACVGFLLGAILGPAIPARGLTERTYVEAASEVLTVPKLYPDGCSFEAKVGASRLLVRYRGDTELSLGDTVFLRGLAKPFGEGYEELYLHRLLLGRIDVSDRQIEVLERGPALFRLGIEWRRSFVEYCSRALPPDVATAVDALCFNVDGGLDSVTRKSLQSTGTVHIISASGLHVMVFAFALQALLACWPVPRWLQLLLLFAVLALYVCATGMRPAVLRAVLMTLIYFSAYLVRREPDLLASLAAVAVGYLLWKPEGVYDIGFQFSFITVAALGLFAQRGRSESSVSRLVKGCAVAGLAAAPLTAVYFGLVSVVSLPANLLIAPAVGPIIVGSLAGYAMNPVLPGLAHFLMAGAVAPLTSWIYWVLDTFGSLRWATFSAPAVSGYWVLALYVAWLGAWTKRVRHA